MFVLCSIDNLFGCYTILICCYLLMPVFVIQMSDLVTKKVYLIINMILV